MAEKPTLWTGTIDLHQGDRGKISFTKQGTSIHGTIQVRRGDKMFAANEINGTWEKAGIKFTRRLDATSIQPFEGETETEPDNDVLITGRFANKLQGRWSAIIHRASASPKDTKAPAVDLKINGLLAYTVGDHLHVKAIAEDNVGVEQTTILFDGVRAKSQPGPHCNFSRDLKQPGRHRLQAEAVDAAGNRGRSEVVSIMVHPTEKAGPSLTTHITPSQPTEQDRIEFKAKATHDAGVLDISHHINGRRVRTCTGSRCVTQRGPFPPGTITWRVSARGNDGGKSFGMERTIIITRKEAGVCRISGKAVGPKRKTSQVYRVALFGPDNLDKLRDSTPFDTKGRFSFPNIPAGRYRLVIDTKADTPVRVSPSRLELNCRGAGVNNLEIKFT